MKSLWNNFKVAFSMFSKIPMPRADWTEENMKYMICFFPFVGTVIGFLSMGAAYAGKYFGFGQNFTAVVLVLLPVFVTGGIHVDGLLDTADALSSWRDRERRLEILKDSHAGAFAVITACVYFLAWFGAYSELIAFSDGIVLMALGFMVSRCLSGIGVVSFPKARADGTVAEFSKQSENRFVQGVLIFYLVVLFILMILVSPLKGIITFVTALLIFAWYYHMAMKYFGGTTGDLSGYFLCLCELGMAWSLALSCVIAV